MINHNIYLFFNYQNLGRCVEDEILSESLSESNETTSRIICGEDAKPGQFPSLVTGVKILYHNINFRSFLKNNYKFRYL